MSCFGLLFGILFAVALLYASTSRSRARSMLRSTLLRSIATSFGGIYVGGSWLSSAKARFRYGDTFVTVEPTPISDGQKDLVLAIRMNWPGQPLQCEISPRSDLPNQTMLTWRQTVIAFDSAPTLSEFCVVTDNERRAKEWLTPSVRWEIQQLATMAGTFGTRFAVSQGQLTIERTGDNEIAFLFPFIRRCFALYDQSRLSWSKGISFLHQDMAAAVDEAMCPICGEQVIDDLVFCQQCKAVHHGDCWQYNGRCATYGCGEHKPARPPRAQISDRNGDSNSRQSLG